MVSGVLLAVAVTALVAGAVRADVGEKPVEMTAAAVQPGAGGTGTVLRDRANVRSRPSTTAEVVAQLPKGDQVSILETKNVTEAGKTRDWVRIPLPATAKCYVSAKLVEHGAVTADAVNVRCGPGSNFRDVGKLAKGDAVQVLAREGDWAKIKPTTGCSGWLAAELIEVTPPAPPAAAAPVPEPAPVVMPLPTPAPAAPEVRVINTDPDFYEQYSIKVGVLESVAAAAQAPAPYELLTPEVERRQYRICYVQPGDQDLARYADKPVRVVGMETWHRGDRYPVLKLERLDLIR